jgi:hypothetical protein
MPLGAAMAVTPYYVLMDGSRRIGPFMAPSRSGIDCAPIYGFSNSSAYHKFRQTTDQQLNPYPLVKVYLRLRAGAADNELKLVVIDAASQREPHLRAATIADVLHAHENKSAHVSAGYQLVYDQEASAYRVESASA